MRPDQTEHFGPVIPQTPFQQARVRQQNAYARLEIAREELAEAEREHRAAKDWSDSLDPTKPVRPSKCEHGGWRSLCPECSPLR
jgi:hypothetical protein